MRWRTAVAAVVVGVLSWPAASAAAQPAAGALTVTRPGSSAPLDHGTTTTAFGVALPGGARCDGDSAHDGYHVFSFLVPAATRLDSLRFTSIPDRGYPLVASGVPYEAANTALVTGRIVGVPLAFSWSRLSRDEVLPGGRSTATWRLGVACASAAGSLESAWTTGLTFTAVSNGSMVWRTTVAEHAAAGFAWSSVTPVVVALLLGGAFLLLTRQRRGRSRTAQAPRKAKG